jgi:hypothetical protein
VNTTGSTSSSSIRISTGASPGKTTGSTGSREISTGAKAGIVTPFLLIVLIALFYFGRRGKTINGISGKKPLKPSPHELITTANTNEMSTKHNVPEMDEQNSGRLNPAVAAIESRSQRENLLNLIRRVILHRSPRMNSFLLHKNSKIQLHNRLLG